jgi:hypothetical protein
VYSIQLVANLSASTTNTIPCTRCGGKGYLCPDDPPHAVAPKVL